jgi:TonB family protein
MQFPRQLVLRLAIALMLYMSCHCASLAQPTPDPLPDAPELTQDYFDRQSEKLRSSWKWTESTPEVPAEYQFTIDRSGAIKEVSRAVSSKNANFDARSESALKATAPFDPLPASLQDLTCTAHFEDTKAATYVCKAGLDFSKYKEDVQRRLKRGWFPPRSSTSTSVTVRFSVLRSGEFTHPVVVKSNGDYMQNMAAIKAVNSAERARPLPVGSPPRIGLEIELAYNVMKPSP